MALAIWSAQVNWRKGIVLFLLLTMLLGSVFLGIKAVEYTDKFEHHHVPGADSFQFVLEAEHVSDHGPGHRPARPDLLLPLLHHDRHPCHCT